MKRFFTLLLIAALVSAIACLKIDIPLIKAATPIHQGDLIISGNDVFSIKSEEFTINGSIRVIENATLELKDAIVNFTQAIDFQHHVLLYNGNPKLKVDNATIVSAYNMTMLFDENSSVVIDDFHSSTVIYIETYHATLSISNSEVHRYFGTGSSNVTISNCEFHDSESWGDNMSISDSILGPFFISSSTIMMSNSSTKNFHALGSASISVSDNLRVNGSLLLEQNATLTLRNATLEFPQEYSYQFNMTLTNPVNGNPRLVIENATITTGYYFFWAFFSGTSVASMDKLTAPRVSLDLAGSSDVLISNSILLLIYPRLYSSLNISDSTVASISVSDDSSANIQNCALDFLRSHHSSTLRTSDSLIETLQPSEDSTVWLVNSTYNNCNIYNQSNVYVSWYLDVHVIDSIDQNVPSAEVDVYYPNATLAESESTDADGWIRSTLLEKMMNATGEYPIGAYSVEASYDDHSNNTAISMTGNQAITLRLPDFIIPEFPSLAVLPLFMIAILSVILLLRRKHLPL